MVKKCFRVGKDFLKKILKRRKTKTDEFDYIKIHSIYTKHTIKKMEKTKTGQSH